MELNLNNLYVSTLSTYLKKKPQFYVKNKYSTLTLTKIYLSDIVLRHYIR